MIDVYLPAMIFVPMYYKFPIPHVAQLSACDAALLPIVLVTLVKYGRQWRIQRCDIWIALFALGLGYSEGRLKYGTGLRAMAQMFVSAFLPYIVGKLLIEREELRERFVRRLVWLVAIVALLSVVEFRLSRNLFTAFYTPIFSLGPPNIEQIRGGFTRTQGPFGHAIVAGIVYGSVWILALWLSHTDKLRLGSREPRFFGVRRSMVLVWVLFLGLLMTWSRGPWIGTLLAFAISRIGPAKNVARTATIVVILALVAGGATYAYINAYTSGTFADAKDIEQQNAIYRRVLLYAYIPIAEAGGVFGWGPYVPEVPGMPSVDNQYLVLYLSQGLFGLWTFLLFSTDAIVSLLASARRLHSKSDFHFSITLLGVLCGILLTLASVALDSQAYQIFFLFVGWGLSVQATQDAAVLQPTLASTSHFRRTFS